MMRELIGIIVISLLLIFGITWAVQGNNFFMYKMFAPKVEQVRYDVFKNSQSYNDGIAQELQQLQLEYIKGSVEQRAAIGTMVLHKVAGYKMERLDKSLQNFINTIKQERGIQ